MSVHALFRMAHALFPVRAHESTPAKDPPAPDEPAAAFPLPPTPSPPSPPPFRPSHALYSSVTGRHAQLQRYRQNYRSTPAPAARPAEKEPPDAPKTPDSAPQETP